MLHSTGRIPLLVAALLLAGQAPSTVTAADKDALPKVEFEKYTLPNGLQVILHIDRKLPVVHVNQWFHVGSKNERFGRTGFAHLFEHMMFQGSKNASEDYFTYAEKAGANLREGGVNGTTNTDRTNYFATVPSGNLENVLWFESDRLATLLDGMTQEKLDNQRDVVKNERRQSYENRPYGRWIKLVFENLHPAGHPYSWTTIGSHEDLTAASMDDVSDFFRQYYTPNNLSLVIAGDFDPAEAKRLVAKYFGGIAPGPALDRPELNLVTLETRKVVEAFDRVPQERLFLAYPAPQYFSDEEAPLDMASAILTDGLSSRLNRALVYDRQLCSDVNSFNFTLEISGMFIVIATARPGVSLDEIEQVIATEITRLGKEGPTVAELERAKTKQEFTFVSGLEGIGGFGGKSDKLNMYNTYLGDPGMFETDVKRYRAVTVDAVKNVTKRWLDTPNRLVVRFRPETSERATEEIAVDRSQEPALGEDRPFQVPEVKTAKLANGLELFVVERSDLPKVAARLVTGAGAVRDPAGKAGTANLVIRTIDMGTTTRSSLEIVDQLGDLGTQLSGNAGRESAYIELEVLKRNLSPALAILADVAIHPQFPEDDFQREKSRALDALTQVEKDANGLAARVRTMLAYGPDHPYGRPSQGLPATVEALTRADLQSFHGTQWKPGGAALILVGDISLAEATTAANAAFGNWTGGAPPALSIPAAQPAPVGTVYLIDQPDAAQTIVTQYLPAPARTAPDYYPLQLVDLIWGGGGFGTRLNLNLREDKGYSYGVFSSLALHRDGGMWFASGGVQTDKTKESLVEFVKELADLTGERQIGSEELEHARVRRLRGYAQQFESLNRIGGQISDLWALGLPMDELSTVPTAVRAATLEQVRAAAKSYSRPNNASLLLVGDRSKIEDGIKSLGIGEIVVLDKQGRRVTETARSTSLMK